MNQLQVGDFIKRKRLENGLTQEQLAEKMGVSQRTVSRWETGINMPDIGLLSLLAEVLHTSEHELLNGQEDLSQKNKTNSKDDCHEEGLYKFGKTRKVRTILTVVLALLMACLLDVSIGYFATSLHWMTNGKEFLSHGVIFWLIYGRDRIMDPNGVILTQLFSVFLCFAVLLCIIIIFLLFYNLNNDGGKE